MTKLNKVEGAKEKCPICTGGIVCRLKPAKGEYPAKLQWQNPDGTAHYNYDFKTDSTTCNSVTPAAPKETGSNTPVATSTELEIKLPTAIADPQVNKASQTVVNAFAEAHSLTKQIYPKLPETSNVFGQIRCKFVEHILQALAVIEK